LGQVADELRLLVHRRHRWHAQFRGQVIASRGLRNEDGALHGLHRGEHGRGVACKFDGDMRQAVQSQNAGMDRRHDPQFARGQKSVDVGCDRRPGGIESFGQLAVRSSSILLEMLHQTLFEIVHALVCTKFQRAPILARKQGSSGQPTVFQP
jgi:hypothetical protein